MTRTDEALRRALSEEDLKAYDALGRELSPFALAIEAFRMQNRVLAVAGWAAGFLLFLVAAYAGWRFTAAEDLRAMLQWEALIIVALLGLMGVKLWFWMEMQKSAVIREVKRLEVQVASLAALLPEPRP